MNQHLLDRVRVRYQHRGAIDEPQPHHIAVVLVQRVKKPSMSPRKSATLPHSQCPWGPGGRRETVIGGFPSCNERKVTA